MGFSCNKMPRLVVTCYNISNSDSRSLGKYADIFQDFDFPPSYVTDRPDPTQESDVVSTMEIINQIETANELTPSCSGLQKIFSPSNIRPLPEAPPRKTNTNSRCKSKSTVLTNASEKEALQKEYEENIKKKQKKDVKIKRKGKGKGKGKAKGISIKDKTGVDEAKKQILCSDSEFESEEWYYLVCGESYTTSKED